MTDPRAQASPAHEHGHASGHASGQDPGQVLPPLHRQREFVLLWSCQVVSTFGAHATGIIYPLLILALTGSPTQAGLATALRIVPYLLLSLPVGALIDRWDRRRVMITCHIGRAAVVASLPLAMAFDALVVNHIYAVAVLEGALHVFFNIAETAALPRVVAAAQLPQATAHNQVGFAVAGITGPALGTWAYQALGRAVPFVLDVATHLIGAVALWRLRTPFTPMAPRARPNLRAEIAEGLRWLWRERLVRDMALFTGGLNFIQAATPLLLIVKAKQLGADDAQIGLIFSMGSVGAILGALVGPWAQRRFSFGQVIVGTIALQAAAFPCYAFAPGALWLGVVYGWIMFFGPIYNVVQLSYRIGLIPDGLQGRVHSSYRLIAFALNPFAAVLCGVTLEHGGANEAVAVFAAVFIALALAAVLDGPVRTAPRQHSGR